MSDARWIDVETSAASAIKHFEGAVRIMQEASITSEDETGYLARMAFMHAMQSGHTSLEALLLRILAMLGEDAPAGANWHAALIRRVSKQTELEPEILPAPLARAADIMRRFRNVASRAYDSFDPTQALTAVEAARLLAAELPDAIARFRRTIDP